MTKDPQLEFIESNIRIVEDTYQSATPGSYHEIQRSREKPSLGKFAWRHLLGLIFRLDRNVDRVVGNLERRLAEVENDAEEDCYDSIQDVDEVKAQLNELKGRFEIALRQLNTNTLDVVRVREKNDTADALAKRLAVIEKQLGINQGTVKQVSFSELASVIVNPIVRSDISEPDEDELDDEEDDEDQRGTPGHPRPGIHERVSGVVARQDMMYHPDTVYCRADHPDLRYRFHEGQFEAKGGLYGSSFKPVTGGCDFDARNGKKPEALTSGAQYRKVDTSRPLPGAKPAEISPKKGYGEEVLTGRALDLMKERPGRIYRRTSYGFSRHLHDLTKIDILFRFHEGSFWYKEGAEGWKRCDGAPSGGKMIYHGWMAPLGMLYIDEAHSPKRPLIGQRVSNHEAREDMRANPGTVYASEGIVSVCFNGRVWLQQESGGGWKPTDGIHSNGPSGVCKWARTGDRGPIHSSLVPNVRR